jgi:hypothetical protein
MIHQCGKQSQPCFSIRLATTVPCPHTHTWFSQSASILMTRSSFFFIMKKSPFTLHILLSLGILPATRYPNPKYPDPDPKYPNPHYPISSSDSKSYYPNLYWVIRLTMPGTQTTQTTCTGVENWRVNSEVWTIILFLCDAMALGRQQASHLELFNL